jgi:hypothetical protein
VHLAGNPIDHLTDLLAAKRRVRWSYFGMAYRTGSILPKHQLQLILYAVDGLPYTRFHLSHPLLTSPIMDFTEYVVADETKLKYVPSGMLPRDFPVDVLAWLSDHPILVAFHLIGRAARVLQTPTQPPTATP